MHIRLKLSTLLLVVLGFSTLVSQQQVVEIGSAQLWKYRYPIDFYSNYGWSSIIYTSTEIGMSGTINKIAFNMDDRVDQMDNQKIYMRHTSVLSNASAAYPGTTGFTLVYDGTVSNSGTYGWEEIVLNQGFQYNGVDNLEILFENRDGSATGILPYFQTFYTPHYRVMVDGSNASFPTTCTTCAVDYYVPHIQMTINPCNVLPGTATSTGSGTGTVQLSLQNNGGSIYAWQSSSDGINFSDIPGSNQNPYSLSPPVKTYYRAKVSDGNCTSYSNIVEGSAAMSTDVVVGDDVENNTDWTVYQAPVNTYQNYSWSNMIYLSSEIPVAGKITKIAVFSNSNYIALTNQKIYMRQTTDDQFANANYPGTTGFTQVFDGDLTIQSGYGVWQEITLDTPFDYNGTDNLEILVEDHGGTTFGWVAYFSHTAVTNNRMRHDGAYTFPMTCNYCQNTVNLPDMRFTIDYLPNKENAYAHLTHRPPAKVVRVTGDALGFMYKEEYTRQDGESLDYKIYDWQKNVLLESSGLSLPVQRGENFFLITDLKTKMGQQDGIYMLEVTDPKGAKQYLRFKLI